MGSERLDGAPGGALAGELHGELVVGRLADLFHPDARVVLGQAVLAAVGHLTRAALADDVNRGLRAALRRVEHGPTPLLAPAPEPEREVDRVARQEAVCGERAVLELVRAKDEALLVGRDRGAVRDREPELGNGGRGCEGAGAGANGSVSGRGARVWVGTKWRLGDLLNERERPLRSLTKICMVAGLVSG